MIFRPIFLLIVSAVAMAICCPGKILLAQEKTPALPKFEDIEKTVWRYFQAQGDFQPSALITKEQVEPLLTELKRMGFNLPDPKSTLDKLPLKDEFLPRELDSPAGRKFMENIAKYPEAYDRLDRLSRLLHGKRTVHDLIYGAGGYKMIQYMTATPGGKEMGKMLSQAPRGADFNKPTGRIYTMPMLLKHLQEQYRLLEKKATEKNLREQVNEPPERHSPKESQLEHVKR